MHNNITYASHFSLEISLLESLSKGCLTLGKVSFNAPQQKYKNDLRTRNPFHFFNYFIFILLFHSVLLSTYWRHNCQLRNDCWYLLSSSEQRTKEMCRLSSEEWQVTMMLNLFLTKSYEISGGGNDLIIVI